jgi:hypothetical protein
MELNMMTLMEALVARHVPTRHAGDAAITRDPAPGPTRCAGGRLKRTMLMLSLLLIGGGLLAIQANRTAPNAAVAKVDCSRWDRAASVRVAALVGDESAAAQLRLDEALMQLRRARQMCRSGFFAVAESDYRSLERAIPGGVTAFHNDKAKRTTRTPTNGESTNLP